MPTGTITALRAQANASQRVNVFLDGEFAIGVSLNTLAREGLAVGQQIDAAGMGAPRVHRAGRQGPPGRACA